MWLICGKVVVYEYVIASMGPTHFWSATVYCMVSKNDSNRPSMYSWEATKHKLLNNWSGEARALPYKYVSHYFFIVSASYYDNMIIKAWIGVNLKKRFSYLRCVPSPCTHTHSHTIAPTHVPNNCYPIHTLSLTPWKQSWRIEVKVLAWRLPSWWWDMVCFFLPCKCS